MADTAEQIQELVVRYPRLEDAVKAAMIDALRKNGGDHREWGGAVFQRGNEFYATAPQSSGENTALQIKARADQPGDHAVAIYHTHPNTPTSSRFSRDDVEFAKAFGRPSFLSDGGDVQVFDPKVDKAPHVAPSERGDMSIGSAQGRTLIPRELLARALRAATTPQGPS